MTDDANIGEIEIILNGVDVKLEIALIYWMRSIESQTGKEQG